MKTLIGTIVFALLGMVGMSQESKKVFGKVSDGTNPMENVNVSVPEKDISSFTDTDGKYEILVAVGDKIQFSYTGMRTISIKVEDVTRVLNPIMIPDITELEEVEVSASKRRSQKDLQEDYAINGRIIRTAWGYLDADRAPGRIQVLTEEEINPISLNVLGLLQNRFPGIRTIGTLNGTQGAVLVRGANSLGASSGAIFDVDGQIFTDVPWWVDVNKIRRVAILSNLATTASYGSFGGGGVIVINTFSGSPKNDVIVDRARLRNNYADGLELSIDEIADNAPIYLKEFRQARSFAEAKVVFEKYRDTYSNSPYFLLDTYTHFIEVYDEEKYADSIITDYFGPYTNNPVLMKALAYIYESQKRLDKANEIYKEVFILRPNYVQSYMDMANSYRNIREPKQAASMYARYNYLVDERFIKEDTIGFGPIMEREFNNLLMLEKGAVVEGRKAKKLFVAEESFKGTRLVFEWNDGEAEFDLQFVNPENQYHKWQHSMAESEAAIEREKDFGYNVKEYLLDGSLLGTWKVNVNYRGNKSLSPTYLKATVYYDYGSKTQKKEVKVFKLYVKNVNQELFLLQSIAKMGS